MLNYVTEWYKQMDGWLLATIVYCISAVVSFIPVLMAIFKKVELLTGGLSYNDSPFFTQEQKIRLNQHYSRIQGTLGYWKNRAAKHYRFHLYIGNLRFGRELQLFTSIETSSGSCGNMRFGMELQLYF